MSSDTESSEPIAGWSWARVDVPGEEFRSAIPDTDDWEWDRAVDRYVGPDRLRWTREVEGALRVAADFAVVDGKVLCTNVQHFGTIERPVNTTAIRDVALDEVGRAAFVNHAKREHMGRESTAEEKASRNESAAFFYTENVEISGTEGRTVDRALRGTRGRPQVTREELEHAARIYRESERKPVQAVSIELDLTERTAARRIEQARKAGLLPPTTPGKVGK